jgi:uncharacterized membrane protein
MKQPNKIQSPPPPQPTLRDEKDMPFGKMNYLIFLAGFGLVILGFLLMIGEPFIDAKEFSRALYISPPMIMAGFGVIAWGIMIDPSKRKKNSEPDANK